MVTLDSRCREIVLLLLQSEKPITTQDIASELGINSRMVRYSFKKVKLWFKENEAALISKPNYGFLIDCEPDVRAKIISGFKIQSNDNILLPSERLHVVILALLIEEEPVLVKQLEHKLDVSRPTILRDLQKAERFLNKHNLSLKSKPHFGFQAIGRERDYREALVSLLLESCGENLVLTLCEDTQTKLVAQVTSDSVPLREFIDSLDLRFSKYLLDKAITRLQMNLSDHTYVLLILHLAILINRTAKGQKIDFPLEHLLSFNAEKEFKEAKEITVRIQQFYNIALNDSEAAYLAARFLATRRSTLNRGDNQSQDSESIDPKLQEIVQAIVADASNYLHPYLRVDQELINNLTLHLRPVLFQLLFGLPTRNPLLDHIKRQYPYIFKVAQKSVVNLQLKTDLIISEEEIGYIAMYLGAAMERLRNKPDNKKRIIIVCVEGVATAWMLVSRILAELPDVEIVQILSLLELRKKRSFSNQIDAVVATIPLEFNNIPVLTVNPLLPSEDISKLRNDLGLASSPLSHQMFALASNEDPSLLNLITKDTTRLKVNAFDWQDVVDKASEPLIGSKAIETRYINSMKQTIIKHGPYAVTLPNVVLLHARPEDGVNTLCMSLMTLKSPVYFGHPENDPVDIIFVIGAADVYSHLRALRELTSLLIDENALDKIRKSTSWQEISEIITYFSHIR